MRSSIVKLFLLVLLLAGCTPASYKMTGQQRYALAHALGSLDPHIPAKEAERLALELQHTAEALNRQFERTTDPKFHNFLINVGLKEKGLCYHYCDALYLHVNKEHYPHFDFHLAGANIGSFWREHNALVVTARGEPVSKGIVIDAWRDPQKLYFSKVNEDTAYHWIHRPERECCQKGR